MTIEKLQLIALPTSPFAARLHIQIWHKGLKIDTQFPDAGTTPAEHGALNPFSKTPILLVGTDSIVESGAIAEYLEDCYPEPGMRGKDALATARIRAFIRAVDLYLYPLMFRLRALQAGDAALPGLLAELHQTLSGLESLSGQGSYVCGDDLNLADCALIPACFYLDLFLARQGQADFRLQHPVLKDWWQMVLPNSSVTAVIAGLNQALNKALKPV